MQLAPVVEREIDHREAGGREFLDQPLARLDVARRDQQGGQFGKPGIVADQQQAVHGPRGLLDDVEQRVRSGLIERARHERSVGGLSNAGSR